MVRAWFMNDYPTNQREDHHLDPPKYVSVEDLNGLTSVEYFQLNLKTYNTDGVLEMIIRERGYTYEDESACSEKCFPNFQEALKLFFTEHLHDHDEVRFCLDGSGFFDVRDKYDRWIRIQILPGDLLIIPTGIYHRFTLDKGNYIKAKRFFVGEPDWTGYDRPADDMECRQNYLKKMQREILA